MHLTSIVANDIIKASNAKSIRAAIAPLAPADQHEALKMAADHILNAVEANIADKNHQVAIWELSKLAIVEDELLNAERRMNHVVSLVVGARG
jgi:hypothetical protein